MPRPHSQHSQHSHRRSQSPRNSSRKQKTSNKSCGSLYTWLLSLLAVFLLGTVLVLSVVKSFFGVDWNDAIDTQEVHYYESLHTLPYGSSAVVPPPPSSNNATIEKIPRILHQTWKSSLLPSKWAIQSKKCQEMHEDFEYKLWTDESSLEFIKEFYPWFLPTFLGYKFDIQRADAIRYFVLHKYGGVYMDLDIGCRRPMHPLLNYQTILPVTKPVGISNDLMFAEPNSKFMDSVIHNLVAFDHTYISDYPTVMFSTGPMFLSAVLSLWNSRSSYAGVSPAITSNPNSTLIKSTPNSTFSSFFSSSTLSQDQHGELHTVRILPKELYGKNVDPELVPDSFFYHYYGSSWHQNDSAIFTFLGSFGKTLMNVAFGVVILGGLFIVVRRIKRRRNSSKCTLANGGYGLLNNGRETPNGLEYDSDVEDGNGRATPPLHQLPRSARSTPSSSSRRRRRQHRRAITSGARNWLFGNRSIGISLGGDTAAFGGVVPLGTGNNNGRLRRSASTGAIALPLHSSESEDAQFYTSSSEDGRESRRDSIFGIDGTGRRADVRRASIWMGEVENGVDGDDASDLTVVTSSQTAPLLHRRTSSQPGLGGKSGGGGNTTGSRTPVPPSYLELPPPPPYRPPSPISPTLSASSLLPLPLSPSHRAWLSSFFSSAANTARSPSPSAQSSSQLPFFSNNASSSNSNEAHYHHSRSISNQSQSQNQSAANHARIYSVPSYPSSPSVVSSNNHNNPASTHYRQHSSNSNAAEVFISQYDERSPARRSESIDDDAFSLHSVKARR